MKAPGWRREGGWNLSVLRLFVSILVLAFALGGTVSAMAADDSIGAACARDPSCVIVGNTHMLVWKSPEPRGIFLVCIHGLGLCARAYKPLAGELSKLGFDGYAVNVRGFGPDRNQPEREKLDCVDTVGDVCELLKSIRQKHPEERIILMGESMGGALAIRIAAEHPELIDGLVASAPAWKLHKLKRTAVKGVVELVLFPHSRPGPAGRGVLRQATSDPELKAHWLNDPAHKLKLSLGEATAFLGFIGKTDRYAREIERPVLIVQGLNDRLVSARAVARLYRDMPSSNKTFLIAARGEHLVLEEGLFSDALIEKLRQWLDTTSASNERRSEIVVVDDQDLSEQQERHLDRLKKKAVSRRSAGSQTRVAVSGN
ncbi:MAG: alpha/beta fold hydrolase [Candidatus Obscuribacterales bacterium]